MTLFSAFVPCFNNELTVAAALLSLQRQSLGPSELFVVDDGSVDGSCAVAVGSGVSVIAMGRNTGRGAVRAEAIFAAHHDYLLCCDATNQLPVDFAARAISWFEDPNVAAVFGRIWQSKARSVADRWRGRHLFKVHHFLPVQHRALLSTYGCVLRRESVIKVGNFDRSLRHSEDADLGRRLLDAGFDVVFDPELLVISNVTNTVRQVLERYWRWHAGSEENFSFYGYVRQVWYSLKVMVPSDIRDGDLLCLPLSLICPHYQFCRSLWRHFSSTIQK